MQRGLDFKKTHFIGIGGAGMSGIAKVMLAQGFAVSGSDIKHSANISTLKGLGAEITIGHHPNNLNEASAVVISSAIRESNPELKKAKETGVVILKRAEMIALLADGLKNIAIAGTHGKTTTTSMVSMIFENANLDPTFLIGGELNDIGSNAKFGRGKHFITEADESDASFLFFRPDAALITNIEEDHLDYYSSLSEIEDTFIDFISLIKDGGDLVIFGDHPVNLRVIERVSAWSAGPKITTYGFSQGVDFQVTQVDCSRFGSEFILRRPGQKDIFVKLNVTGQHNVANALGAFAIAKLAGISDEAVLSSLENFPGVKRRFQRLGFAGGALFIDDYAHHPSEVAATLSSAKAGDWPRVICVFQPHRYSRTKALTSQFGKSFDLADKIIIIDIYGAGEPPEPGVTGKLVADSIRENNPSSDVVYLPTKLEVKDYLKTIIRPGDLVITMGAGDIHTVGEDMIGGNF